MALLGGSAWRGKVFLGGWTAGGGGEAAVIEPATGEEIGRSGRADAQDVASAARQAAAAQPGWAATPHSARAAILRKAAGLRTANAAEIEQWVIRETGKIPPAAQFETHVSTGEIYEAATLPTHPVGHHPGRHRAVPVLGGRGQITR